MKRILFYLVLALGVLTVYSCQDLEKFEAEPINLGAKSTSTGILGISSVGTQVTVKYNLTVGAKYSVQVYKFGELEPVKTLPMTAQEEITTKVYEFTDLQTGIYDLVLTDVAGVSVKQPLLIKR